MRTIDLYRDAEAYLAGIPAFTTKHSLDNTEAFLTPLSIKEASFRLFHIAGTNGKGSAANDLEQILLADGRTVGTFVSPHLITTRERIRIGGKMIDEELFVRAFAEVKAAVDDARKEKRAEHPTYFEFLFLMAMTVFRDAGVADVILETGLGGEKDVTNLFHAPFLSVITSIGLDHTQFLGHTLPEVARAKAGIIKEGRPVVFLKQDPAVNAVIEEEAKKKHAEVFAVDPTSIRILSEEEAGITFEGPLADGTRERFRITARASYQTENAMLAVRAAEAAGVQDLRILREGLLAAYWPARMDQVLPGIYLDGAHNPAGVKALLSSLKDLEEHGLVGKKRTLLFAVSEDKDYREMANELIADGGFTKICLSSLPIGRPLDIKETAKAFSAYGGELEVTEDPLRAFNELREKKEPDETVIAAGSLYLAGLLLAQLRGVSTC